MRHNSILRHLEIPVATMLIGISTFSSTAMGAMTALEAFQALSQEEETETTEIKGQGSYLEDIMNGKFNGNAQDATNAEELAQYLQPLCEITNRELAAYASEHHMKMAQVKNAYYLALANVLKAEIAVHPSSEEKYQNIQTILSLFLNTESTDEERAQKEEIRSGMSPKQSAVIADQYQLPASFVEFVIMDENWNDDSWENDDDWMDDLNAANWTKETFENITIGSRDSGNSTLIADLQEILISLGYLKGKADGIFGPRTQAALLEFQLANGFAANGIYGTREYDKLRDAQVVARWDYGEDFWDSEDFDAGKDTPDTPDTPDGDTPDYNSRDNDTPDVDTPDYSTPDHDTPDNNTPDYDTPVNTASNNNIPVNNAQSYDTPDNNTPDYDTPVNNAQVYNTQDNDTPDYDSPDNDTPDYDTDD